MKSTLSVIIVACYVCFGSVVCHAAAEKKSAPDASSSLYKKISKIDSVTAVFTQTITDHENHLMQKSKGKLNLQRPQNIYWETFAPYEQVVVGDEKILWVYDPDLEQATKYNSGDQMKGPMTLLSSSEEKIKEQYQVSYDHDNTIYVLVPKVDDANNSFSELRFGFDKSILKRIEILDKTRQLTVITLDKVKQNKEIPSAQFVFNVPKDVDIVVNE